MAGALNRVVSAAARHLDDLLNQACRGNERGRRPQRTGERQARLDGINHDDGLRAYQACAHDG